MNATRSRDPEEPRAFTDDDNHDESFEKQQQVSVVGSTPPNHGGKKNVVLQLFMNDEYALYDSEKKKEKQDSIRVYK